jgi:folylpolyglutamate synthase
MFMTYNSIEEAVTLARKLSKEEEGECVRLLVLVTGSLHLVGGLIKVLDSS